MARNFNTSSNVNAAIPASLQSYTNVLSISAWFNPAALSSSSLAQAGFGTSPRGMTIVLYGGSSTTRWGGLIGGNFQDSGQSLSTNSWSHLVITKNATTGWILYKNGVQIATGTATMTAATNADVYYFTNIVNTGLGADLAIWTTQLTALEITALSQGIRPYNIRPGSLQVFLPVDGIQSPEPSMDGTGETATVVGTAPLGFGPPFAPLTPRWPQLTIAPVSTFQAAWAMRNRIVVDGIGI